MSAEARDGARLADARARERAQREFSAPLAIEAGAGTGKTAVLVARIVAWSVGSGWQRAEQRLRGAPEAGPDAVAAEVLRRVAAITFTEAAAAEMETRVGLALRQLALGELPQGLDPAALPAEAELRAVRARALAANRDQLSVRTIHAFCRRILAAHPLEAGLHPRFEIDAQQRLQAQVARELVEARLREAFGEPGSPDFLELADQGLGPVDLEVALQALLLQGVPAAALAEDPLAAPRIRLFAAALRAAVAGFLTEGGERLVGVSGAPRIASTASATRATLRHLEEVPETPAAFAAWLEGLRAAWDEKDVKKLGELAAGEFGKKGSAALASPAMESALAARAAALHPLLKHALSLQPGLLALLRRVLHPLLDEAEARLRRRGVLGFAGILRETRALLAKREDVAAALRGDLDQLLVDEFQDTDAIQCEILGALALAGPRGERPGLFVVGDPKQSIFGWRSADLAAYEAFLARLRAEGGSVERLAVNFRSVPAILGEVARVVAPAMQEQAGLQPRFESLLACDALAAAPGFGAAGRAPVEHWISWAFDARAGGARALSARRAAELEARAVARDLREIHDREGVPYDRMALLFRGTGDFEIYLAALRERAVPFVVERDTTFYQRREIVDALALVCCVLDPHDHLALVTALRSSVVGVPDAALVPLWRRELPDLAGRVGPSDAGGSALARLREAVAKASAELPADVPGIGRIEGWDANLLAFALTLAELRDAFEREPAARFVERLRTSLLLEATEGARHLGAWRIANLDRFFRALAEALEETGGDRAAVLSHLRRAVTDEREHEEGRPRAAAEDAVHVTTIHKAKGLDFDHVYVLQLHKGGGQDDPRETRVAADAAAPEYKLCGVASLAFHEVARRRAEIERHERVRLFYVALTRARQRLVLAGSYPRTPGPTRKTLADLWALRDPSPPDLESLMAELAPAARCALREGDVLWSFPALAGDEPAPAAAPAVRAGTEAARVERGDAELARLGALARERAARGFHAVASQDRRDTEAALAQDFGEEEEQGSRSRPRWRDEDRARRIALAVGTAVHAGLERLEAGLALADQRRRFAAEVEAALALGVGPEDRPAVRARALEVFERFRAGPLYERMRGLGSRLLARELPVLLAPAADEGPVGFWSGSIDLLYWDAEAGEYVVVDYKTDRVASAQAREVAERYRPQGQVYARAVQAALGLPAPPRFELWFLSPGEVVALSGERPARG